MGYLTKFLEFFSNKNNPVHTNIIDNFFLFLAELNN